MVAATWPTIICGYHMGPAGRDLLTITAEPPPELNQWISKQAAVTFPSNSAILSA
jgi:hypothetical protein